MAFLIHLLRHGDLFADVGANIGSYTVLASAVCGSNTIAIEPDPDTMIALRRNVAANGIGELVSTLETAVGAEIGEVKFTVGGDTVNRIANNGDTNVRTVRMDRLDNLLAGQAPTLIKLDVEGSEGAVLAGASELLSCPSLLAIETEGHDTQVVTALAQAGFKEFSYDPWTRQLQEGRGQSSNALYLRELDLIRKRLHSSPTRTIVGIDL